MNIRIILLLMITATAFYLSQSKNRIEDFLNQDAKSAVQVIAKAMADENEIIMNNPECKSVLGTYDFGECE